MNEWVDSNHLQLEIRGSRVLVAAGNETKAVFQGGECRFEGANQFQVFQNSLGIQLHFAAPRCDNRDNRAKCCSAHAIPWSALTSASSGLPRPISSPTKCSPLREFPSFLLVVSCAPPLTKPCTSLAMTWDCAEMSVSEWRRGQ